MSENIVLFSIKNFFQDPDFVGIQTEMPKSNIQIARSEEGSIVILPKDTEFMIEEILVRQDTALTFGGYLNIDGQVQVMVEDGVSKLITQGSTTFYSKWRDQAEASLHTHNPRTLFYLPPGKRVAIISTDTPIHYLGIDYDIVVITG